MVALYEMPRPESHKAQHQSPNRYLNMAMSKKCFVFLLCVIGAIIIGAVAFVLIQMRGHKEDQQGVKQTESKDTLLMKQNKEAIDMNKAEMMCESIINGTEPTMGAYNHPSMFHAVLGVNAISIRVISDYVTSDTYQKSSFWLTGDPSNDRETMSQIRADACRGKIPVIVMSMRPRKGISLSRKIQMWNHYRPTPLLETWTEYDKKLNNYLRNLSPVPAIVILEPDLLMFTFDSHNLQFGWLNDKYKEEFYQRAQKVIKVMSRSWIYVDAGNAAYLRIRDNMENMAKSLLRLDGLRGFSINTAHFFNASYTNMMARRLHCLTGLHYVVDTSRNGGSFSRQSAAEIEKCYFDPPKMIRGLPPGWSWGTKLSPRQKRWSPPEPQPSPPRRVQTPPPPPQPSTVQMLARTNPPNPQEDPEAYNQWVNSMKNSGAHAQNSGIFGSSTQGSSTSHHQPNNRQPSNTLTNNNRNGGNRENMYNDLSTPSGRVGINAITAAPTTSTFRNVELRTAEEALAIFRTKTMRRGQCLKREAVTVHDANVWIKTPGEADGRLYEYGTYHKCLLGHDQPCNEQCRLITHAEQRSPNCGCEETNDPDHNPDQGRQSQDQEDNNPGVFFPGDHGHPPGQSPQPWSQNSQSRSNSNSIQHNEFGSQQKPGSGSPPTRSSLADLLQRGQGR